MFAIEVSMDINLANKFGTIIFSALLEQEQVAGCLTTGLKFIWRLPTNVALKLSKEDKASS